MGRKIVIIGAGIAGLTAAVAMARMGLDAEVYEQAPELKEVGAGVGLWGNAFRALRAIGLADEVVRLAGGPAGSGVKRPDGAWLLYQPHEVVQKRWGAGFASVHRAELHRLLADQVDRSAIHLDARCTGISDAGEVVRAEHTWHRSRPRYVRVPGTRWWTHMTAVWMVVRAALRGRWRSWLVLAELIGFTALEPATITILAPADSGIPGSFWRRKLLAGRLPAPDQPGQVDISFTVAQSQHPAGGVARCAWCCLPENQEVIVAVVMWQAGNAAGRPGPRELDAFLVSIPFFASLNEATRLQLAEQLEPVHVTAGDIVIAQDDAGDGLFLLLSGRLRVSVATGGTERVLHDLVRGAIVGEIALLSDRPRSATVRAVRDSDLLLLRVSAFNALVERTPGLLGQVAGLLVDRLLAVDRPQLPPTGSRTIAVAPAGSSAGPAAQLAAQLTDRLADAGPVIRLDADVVAQHLGPGAAQREPGDPGRNELTGWLHAVERGHDHVVYLTDAQDTAWSRLCLSQSDVVLLTGDATGDPRLGAVESRALATPSLRCELVLVHPSGPSGTSRWLECRPVADFHHLRGGHPEDVARLARMVTGTACGVVLGGGGPRGFAHLGALRALEEAGVPIDIVGGTSIGAVMGALCAQGLSDEERVERAITAFTKSGRLIRPTLPLVAMSSGGRVDRLLAEHLGSDRIEDLPRRFFCVSANLTRAEEVVHERGVLWRAVRASLSLPGIFPPVYADGDLLVDGAALDNVPVEVMRARIGSGPVVAVDLDPEVEPLAAAPFGPGLSGWRVLGRRLNPLAPPRPMPSLIDILSRSTALSGVRDLRAAQFSHRVDLLLHPPLPATGAQDFKAGAALIEVGYRHAAEALERSPLVNRFIR